MRRAQASPDAADASETICSLTFAARVRGVELNSYYSRRKPDTASAEGLPATGKAALITSGATPVHSEGKATSSLRSANAINLEANKGTVSVSKGASAARTTPRRLDKELGSVTQPHLRRSIEKENCDATECK
jgi:hypothetical protein